MCSAFRAIICAMAVNKEHQSRRALHPLLRQASTYGSVAFVGLCDIWDSEWLGWEPKTVQLELRDNVGVAVEPDLFDKIMAARQVVISDSAFRELPAFITLVNALNGDGVDTPVAQPIDPADLAWGVLEMCLLYPPSDAETFSEEIIGYIQESLRWQGVRGIPNSLVNFLPEATFEESAVSDPDTIGLMFGRLTDINDEVTSNLKAWRYQMGQLQLANGTTEDLDRSFRGKVAGYLQV